VPCQKLFLANNVHYCGPAVLSQSIVSGRPTSYLPTRLRNQPSQRRVVLSLMLNVLMCFNTGSPLPSSMSFCNDDNILSWWCRSASRLSPSAISRTRTLMLIIDAQVTTTHLDSTLLSIKLHVPSPCKLVACKSPVCVAGREEVF